MVEEQGAESDGLREYLADRDAPCPSCGYNLRGLMTSACPECNQALTLRVGLREAIGGAYVGAIVGLSVGAGTAALLTSTQVISVITHGLPRASDLPYMMPYPAAAVILGVPLLVLVTRRGRRWFAARSVLERQAAVVLAWMGSVGAFGIWTATWMAN